MRVTEKHYPQLMRLAHDEALKSKAQGGIPIGAVIVDLNTRAVLARGHNRFAQTGSHVAHGEMEALANLGAVDKALWKDLAVFTTMVPCEMCAGAFIRFGIPLCVAAERETYAGAEEYLVSRGVQVIVLDDASVRQMMVDWIATDEGKALWES
ncbi:Cytosine deaminase [Vanrija pseudolonga]|uniref:Cytosine deaminase n=1 Tax=Vanrija pseudolonga TaxID=143232 RepID=A0AAF0Y3L5_9TREE|nr:Cytosine deaminase [Vanrija pseudolonga]